MQQLTATDLQIIEELRKDARQPNHQMAAVIGASEETCRRRIHAMIKSGVLQFRVDVSAEALGMPVSVMLHVEVIRQVEEDNLLSVIEGTEICVVRFHRTISGEQIYEIGVLDIDWVHGAIDHLKGLPSVRKVAVTFLYPNGDHRI